MHLSLINAASLGTEDLKLKTLDEILQKQPMELNKKIKPANESLNITFHNNSFIADTQIIKDEAIERLKNYKTLPDDLLKDLNQTTNLFIVIFTDQASLIPENTMNGDIYISSDMDLARKNNIMGSGIIGYNPFDKNLITLNLTDSIDLKDVMTFLQCPTISTISQETIHLYENQSFPTFYILTKKETIDRVTEELRETSKEFKNQARIALVEYQSNSIKHNDFVGDLSLPVTILFHERKIYRLDDKTTPDTLNNFINNHFKGTLTPFVKKEPPVDNTNKLVKKGVYENAKTLLLNKKKDVFVMFHAHWCGACNYIMPEFKKLGRYAKKHSDKIDLVTIDLEKNSLEEFNVGYYPFFRLFKAETNETIDFNGERSLKGFTEFIKRGHYKIDLLKSEKVEDIDL